MLWVISDRRVRSFHNRASEELQTYLSELMMAAARQPLLLNAVISLAGFIQVVCSRGLSTALEI